MFAQLLLSQYFSVLHHHFFLPHCKRKHYRSPEVPRLLLGGGRQVMEPLDDHDMTDPLDIRSHSHTGRAGVDGEIRGRLQKKTDAFSFYNLIKGSGSQTKSLLTAWLSSVSDFLPPALVIYLNISLGKTLLTDSWVPLAIELFSRCLEEIFLNSPEKRNKTNLLDLSLSTVACMCSVESMSKKS